MNKIKWYIKNWPEVFVAIDLWASEYPRREGKTIRLLRWLIHPACLVAVNRWDDV